MIRNLRRRMDALENAWTMEGIRRESIAKNALCWFQPAEMDLLISAFGAECGGRELSEDESAVRLTYARTLSRECRKAGYPSANGFEDALDIEFVIFAAIAQRISDSDSKLAEDFVTAMVEGRPFAQDEGAAFEKWYAEWTRLYQLMGFSARAGADGREDYLW